MHLERDSNGKFRHKGTTETCNNCGANHAVTVKINKENGVAAFTCPSCGKTQEP